MRWIAAAAAAYAAVLCVWLIGGWGGETALAAVSNYGSLSVALFAVVCTGSAARRTAGRRRAAWILLTIAVAGWATGTGLWIYYESVLRIDPFPSPADAAYLIFPVAACLGLALFPTGFSGHSHIRMAIDGFIIAAALFQISWVTVLRDVYEAGGPSRFAMGLSLAYPVGDVVVIMVALLVLARARTGQRRTLSLLTVGVVLMAVSDSAFVELTAHDSYAASTADAGWVAGLVVIGMAGLLTNRRPGTDVALLRAPTRAALALPYLPTALAIVVCAPVATETPGMGALFVSSVLLVIAVMARQFFVVGENRRLLEVVADQAMRDPLTGIANRALFNDRLAHAMQLHLRDGQPAAVLSLDLDDFKLVNDNLGHPAGDELLKLVAERILECVRPGDTVARLGGDEFAVLMEGSTEHAQLVARRVVTAFDEEFDVDGHALLVRPSVGLALATPGDVGLTADALLKHADLAMYSAKHSTTGGVHTFDAELHGQDHGDGARLTETLAGAARTGATAVEMLGQLRHAIDHIGLTVVYQPKFSLDDERIVGAEALVRWPHPTRGLLAPDEFLPLIREHGLTRALTDLVLRRTLDDVCIWQRDGFEIPVAVNVFAPSLGDLELPARIQSELDDRSLRPEVLTIEITEDLLLDDIGRTRTVLDTLRGRGIRVSIDDFGSGYSTLGYLSELPFDEVKLDRKFIAPILSDARADAIVRAVVDLAHVLGVTTVAEGVENAATATRLREYGCEVAQGFHYSPPVSAAELVELISSRRAPASARSS